MLGLEHARREGKRLGRPKTNDDQAVRDLRRQGMSYQAVQRKLAVSKGAGETSFFPRNMRRPSRELLTAAAPPKAVDRGV